MSNDNQRRHQRILFGADVRIETESGEIHTELLDISLKGAMIRPPEGWSGSPGDALTISIRLSKDDSATIRMHTTLAHADREKVGLNCQEIDLESITTLRRLVELNLGDSELLQRELAALG